MLITCQCIGHLQPVDHKDFNVLLSIVQFFVSRDYIKVHTCIIYNTLFDIQVVIFAVKVTKRQTKG